jgi:hypothetical protein
VTRITRRVEPERLDALPASDPAAIQSRRDLQRLNAVMGNAAAIARRLEARGATGWMRRLVDLGGGDGTLLLNVARRLAPRPPGLQAIQGVVVDRQALVSPRTRAGFEALGWSVETATADAHEWLARSPRHEGTAVVANLFLHHFDDAALGALLARSAARADLFVACEPRRHGLALAASRQVAWIGCNAVTRHDAVVSVRAGFAGRELSALWPDHDAWRADEEPAGLFSHLFVATRETRARR